MSALAGHIRNDYLKWLGALMLLSWAAFSTALVEARWLFADSAYTLFRILNHESLIYDRYANLLQLGPAMLAARAGWPAGMVLHVVNLTLSAFYFVAWLFHVRKSPARSLLFPLMLWCAGPQMFFLGYSEIGMAALFFGLALLANPEKGVRNITGWLGLMLFSHPASTMLIIPVVLYQWAEYGTSRLKLLLMPVVAALVFQWLISPETNTYDSHLLGNLLNAEKWKHIFTHYSTFYFRQSILGWLWPAWVAVFVTVLAIRRIPLPKRSYAVIVYMLLSLLVILTVYADGDAPVMMEKYFYPWLLICVASALYFTKAPVISALMALGIWLSGMFMVSGQRGFYQNRVAEINRMTQEYRKRHQIKVLSNADRPEVLNSVWALPYETMCLSAIQKQQTVTVRISSNGKLRSDSAAASDSLFLGAPFMPPWPDRKLNPRYFRLAPGTYHIDSMVSH